MKFYLFGGAGGKTAAELRLIEKTIHDIAPRQVLWIPFARIQPSIDPDWLGDWIHRYMDWTGIELLDASNETDMSKVEDPLIFLSGGSKGQNLMEELDRRPQLVEIMRNAHVIIGESKGSMALGKNFWTSSSNVTGKKLIEGLNIVPDTIIHVHFEQHSSSELLERDMKELDASYGIGIDTVTAISFNLAQFPEKWEKIGEGNVEVKVNP